MTGGEREVNYQYGKSRSVIGLIDREELRAWNAMNKLSRESYWAEQEFTVSYIDDEGEHAELRPRPGTVACRGDNCNRSVRVASGYCERCIKKTQKEARKPRRGLSTERYVDWRKRLGHDAP